MSYYTPCYVCSDNLVCDSDYTSYGQSRSMNSNSQYSKTVMQSKCSSSKDCNCGCDSKKDYDSVVKGLGILALGGVIGWFGSKK